MALFDVSRRLFDDHVTPVTLVELRMLILVGTFGMAIPFTLTLAALRRIDATRVGIEPLCCPALLLPSRRGLALVHQVKVLK
jgi:drug/metabolite transporter (DMT)-like permease